MTKTPIIILFSASALNTEEVRKDARKLAQMYMNAELEEDQGKQEKLLIEAEKFSATIEEKYLNVDQDSSSIVNRIMDEESEKLNKSYFLDSDIDEDEDD